MSQLEPWQQMLVALSRLDPGPEAREIELSVDHWQTLFRYAAAHANSNLVAINALGLDLPADVQDALRGLGFQFQQQQHLKPVRLQDGRRLVVPIEQFEIVPVADRPYQ